MSDIFSPFLNRSTATFFKSGDIPFVPMIIQKHTQTHTGQHCHVYSDVTTHYFIHRNRGFFLDVVICKQNRRFFDGDFHFR
jgi:hypothetical protein